MSEEVTKKSIIDLATILTIGGIVFYQMGWIYWSSFFSNLNIHSSFIEMPFEKFISTTWYLSLIVIISFVAALIEVFDKSSNSLDAPSALFGTAVAIILVLSSHMSDLLFLGLLVAVIILFALHIYFSSKLKIISKTINKTKFIYVILIIMYLLGLFIYNDLGEKDSKELLENFRKIDTQITLNHDNKFIKGKFIMYMNSKYFILIINKKQQPETVVINESEIEFARFYKK